MKLTYKTISAGLLVVAMFGATNSCALAQTAPATKPVAVAAPAAAPAATTAPLPVRNPLFDTPLAGLPAFTGMMYVTDFLPGAVSAHHKHPGYEFNYILKGDVTFVVDGQAPFTLHAGQATYNPRDRGHLVKNASQTEPAQLVAVLINDAGQPIAVSTPAP